MARTNPHDPVQNTDNSVVGEGVRQYIAFTVDTQEYAVDIMSVREIRVWSRATPIPNSEPDVLGVVNLRGTIVPIVDIRARFNQGRTNVTTNHVVVILQVGEKLIGILVDSVSDILTAGPEEIKPLTMQERITGERPMITRVISKEERIVSLIEIELLTISRSDLQAA